MLARHAEVHIRDLVDPDGTPPSDEQRHRPERELRLHERKDGSLEFTGRLDPENSQLSKGLLTPGEKREPNDDRSPSERSGLTEMDNLVLVCPHHRLIHRSDWEVRLDNGIAWFRLPDYVDSTRTPR